MRLLLFSLVVFTVKPAFAQDVDLYLANHFLPGISVIKMNRDFDDGYMWILAKNNAIYRLNTVTNQLDDYSAKFQPLSGYQIYDIAGISSNWVEVAVKNANSTVLVTYNNGVFSYPLRNNFYTITGNIVNIGASAYITEGAYGFADHPALLISTDKGFYRLVFQTGVVDFNSDLPSTLYSATYRNQMFLARDLIDTSGVNLLPLFATMTGAFDYYEGVLRTGQPFGDNILTAYSTPNQLPYSSPYFTPDLYWGSQNGLFQAKLRNSSPFLSPYKQYLNNIKVNKITDIYGLSAFGNALAKENLLIGTGNGLYYSSSFLHAGQDTTLDKFTLYHFDPLGNIPVNFVEVSAKSTAIPFCEDQIYVATDDGIYLIKPDFKPYLATGNLTGSIHFNDPGLDTLTQQICADASVTAQLNDDVNATSIQWFKNGKPINNANGTSYTINTTGVYNAVLYDPCEGTQVESNHLNVKVSNSPVLTFNYPDKIQQCDNTPLALQTTDNPGYTYRWYTNGVLNGNTTSSYTVTQTGKYKVEVSACTNSWVPSKEIEVDLVTLPVPQVSSDKTVYCAEDIAVLTENAPADPSYTINWYRDGTLLTADNNLTTINETTPGNYTVTLASTISTCTQPSAALPLAFTPAPVFTFNYPDQLQYCTGTPLNLQATGSTGYQYRWYKDGTLNGITAASLQATQDGKYKVEVSSCGGSWVASKQVQVNFVTVPLPAITTDKPVYCIGDNATLSLAQTTDPDFTVQWYKDNVPVPNSIGQGSIVTNVPGNYTVALAYSTPNTDGSTCSQSSAVQAITFNPLPTVSIEKIVNTTICDGQTIGLKANYNSGTVQWSSGETTDQVHVTQAGTYTATVTSTAGCQAAASVDISFLPNPVFSVSDTSICTYKKQVVTLTAPPGFAQYSWNGQTGGQTYQVSLPQTVSLTVTDVNGCQATQQIRVADQCPNIYIPNTFTPNGDGVNDTWVIEGLDSDPGSTVKVFTRNGVQVFNSIGYGTQWNGQYNGKRLPAGAYYYIVTAKNGAQKFSGSLTIIY